MEYFAFQHHEKRGNSVALNIQFAYFHRIGIAGYIIAMSVPLAGAIAALCSIVQAFLQPEPMTPQRLCFMHSCRGGSGRGRQGPEQSHIYLDPHSQRWL